MKHVFIVIVTLIAHFSVHAVTIREMIECSTHDMLARTPTVDPTTTPNILKAFDRIKTHANDPLIMLKVVSQGDLAITAGNSVMIHQSADALTDVGIEFIVAHEIAHIKRGHRERRIRLYEKYVPGQLTLEKANKVNATIGPELKVISWEGEFEADRDAIKMLIALGHSKDDVINAFIALSVRSPDTPTHPSTAKRIMNMKRED